MLNKWITSRVIPIQVLLLPSITSILWMKIDDNGASFEKKEYVMIICDGNIWCIHYWLKLIVIFDEYKWWL